MYMFSRSKTNLIITFTFKSCLEYAKELTTCFYVTSSGFYSRFRTWQSSMHWCRIITNPISCLCTFATCPAASPIWTPGTPSSIYWSCYVYEIIVKAVMLKSFKTCLKRYKWLQLLDTTIAIYQGILVSHTLHWNLVLQHSLHQILRELVQYMIYV